MLKHKKNHKTKEIDSLVDECKTLESNVSNNLNEIFKILKTYENTSADNNIYYDIGLVKESIIKNEK